MYRHNPQTKRAKQLVDDGAIGELRLIRSAFSYSLYDADNIRLRTALDGGALMDVGCYAVSGSRLFGGEPEKVFGEAWFGPSDAASALEDRSYLIRKASSDGFRIGYGAFVVLWLYRYSKGRRVAV